MTTNKPPSFTARHAPRGHKGNGRSSSSGGLGEHRIANKQLADFIARLTHEPEIIEFPILPATKSVHVPEEMTRLITSWSNLKAAYNLTDDRASNLIGQLKVGPFITDGTNFTGSLNTIKEGGATLLSGRPFQYLASQFEQFFALLDQATTVPVDSTIKETFRTAVADFLTYRAAHMKPIGRPLKSPETQKEFIGAWNNLMEAYGMTNRRMASLLTNIAVANNYRTPRITDGAIKGTISKLRLKNEIGGSWIGLIHNYFEDFRTALNSNAQSLGIAISPTVLDEFKLQLDTLIRTTPASSVAFRG